MSLLLENMSEVGLFLSLCWNILPGDLNFEHFDRRLLLAPLKQHDIIVVRRLAYCNFLKPLESVTGDPLVDLLEM